VWWQAADRWRESVPFPVRVNVAAPWIQNVRLHIDGGSNLPLSRIAPYQYTGEIPAGLVHSGTLTMLLEVQKKDRSKWFSHGATGESELPEPFTVCAIDSHLSPSLSGPSTCRAEVVDENKLQVTSAGFEGNSAAGLRLPAHATTEAYDTLVVRAKAMHEETDRVEIGLVQADGNAYGTDVPLWTQWHDIRIPLAHLRPLWGSPAGTPDLGQLDKVSLVFGAWLYGSQSERPHGYEIERVWLEASRSGWTVDVTAADEPLLLFAAGERPVKTNGQEDRHQKLVRGSQPGCQAERIWTDGFGSPPSSISYRQVVPENVARFQRELAAADGLEVVVRATQPQTDRLEVTLVERDSTAWGTVVPITQRWQKIVVPLEQLKFFRHWAHPEGRGTKDERLQLDELSAVNFCFGAWLYGDRSGMPHGVEIESASLVLKKSP